MRIKRVIRLCSLILFMSLTIFPIQFVSSQFLDCLNQSAIATGYPMCIQIDRDGVKSMYMFNETLYRDRGVMVYGNPTSISLMENTFVALTGGYYTSNGKSGEFRYHGFDVSGNKLENASFPNSVSTQLGKQQTWIYRPWTNPNGIMNTALNKPITPGVYATALQISRRTLSNGALKAYEKMQTALGWSPESSYPSSSPVGLLYDYVHVAQKATTRNAGTAYMWALNPQNNKPWLQTFVVPQLVAGDKKMVPLTVKLSVTSMDGEAQPFSFLKSKDVNYKTLNVIVTTTLGDQAYWSSSSLQDEYLNRADLVGGNQAWQIRLYDGSNMLAATLQSATVIEVNPTTLQSEAKAIAQFKLSVPANQINSNGLTLRAEAEAKFITGEKASGSGTTAIAFLANAVPLNYSLQSYVTRDYNKPMTIDPKPSIPDSAFDLVPVSISDNTLMGNVASRTVMIDGVQINTSTFFSSSYVFGSNSQGNHFISITYVASDGSSYTYNKWIYVYDTKPRASFELNGANKVNRLSTMVDKSVSVNDPTVLASYPITSYTYEFFNVDGDLSSLRKSIDLNGTKKFLFKTKGTYGLRLKVTNSLGRTSDNYEVKFYVQDDLPPAIIQHPYNGQVSRGNPVIFTSVAGSADGDSIRTFSHELFWDSNQDNVVDTKIYGTTTALESFTPTHLGLYEVRSHAEEQFGEDTDLNYISTADYKFVDTKTSFVVENYAPAADLFLDRAMIRPKVDVHFMLDSQLAQSTTNYLKNNVVSIRNELNSRGVDAEVSKWDMKSYTYATPMSTNKYTGSSFPESQINYTSGGYTGTLQLYLVHYTTETYDNGSFQTVTDTKTATDTCTNKVTVFYDANGYYGYTSSTSVCPSSKAYNDGKFSGSLLRTGESTSDPYCPSALYPYATCSRTWTAYYAGNISWTHDVWVSNWVTKYYYIGYYSGTGYQTIREPKGEPFQRIGTDRYLVYFSDAMISQSSDFELTRDRQGCKIILVGTDNIKTQTNYDYFVRAGPLVEETVKNIITYIANQVSEGQKKTVLVNEPFEFYVAEYDTENDPILSRRMMIIHDYTTVDNSLGAYASSVIARTDSAWITESYPTSINKPGSYRWIRKVRDAPISTCMTCDYGYDSNEAQVELFVHRKPEVKLAYSKSFHAYTGQFELQWADSSFDPDNEQRRADKGIVERQYRYKLLANSTWTVGLPKLLSAGSYEINAIVKDVNGAWSDESIIRIDLSVEGLLLYTVNGEVNHTKAWFGYHQQRGDETTNPPKSFFAGEKMVVIANVSNEQIETVQARLVLPTINGKNLSKEIQLHQSSTDTYRYEGVLHNGEWASWKEPILLGVYPVTFTALYVNGTSKVMEVPIRIIGSIYESYGVQRLK